MHIQDDDNDEGEVSVAGDDGEVDKALRNIYRRNFVRLRKSRHSRKLNADWPVAVLPIGLSVSGVVHKSKPPRTSTYRTSTAYRFVQPKGTLVLGVMVMI